MQKSDITQKLLAAQETVTEAIGMIKEASNDYTNLAGEIEGLGLEPNELIPECKQTADSIDEHLHDIKDMIDNLNTATEAL